MMTQINHLTTYQQSLFLFLVNGGVADIQIKCSWGWVDIKSATLEAVGQQYHWADGEIETNMCVHRDHTIVHHNDTGEETIAMNFPTCFKMESVISSSNHQTRSLNVPEPAENSCIIL
jgi:hypothetical protein